MLSKLSANNFRETLIWCIKHVFFQGHMYCITQGRHKFSSHHLPTLVRFWCTNGYVPTLSPRELELTVWGRGRGIREAGFWENLPLKVHALLPFTLWTQEPLTHGWSPCLWFNFYSFLWESQVFLTTESKYKSLCRDWINHTMKEWDPEWTPEIGIDGDRIRKRRTGSGARLRIVSLGR